MPEGATVERAVPMAMSHNGVLQFDLQSNDFATARAVAEAGDRSRAAVAPTAAAEIYGLSILRNDIQDSEDNRTRFVLLSFPEA